MLIEFDESAATGGDVVSRLQELDRIIARLQAVQADLLVEAADPAPRIDEFWVLTPGSDEEKCLRIADVIREELGCALRRPHADVQDMIDAARLLAGPLADTKVALSDGSISMDHVKIIVRAAERLPGWRMSNPAEVTEFTAGCRILQERVLKVAKRATIVNTRKSARRAVLAIDPEGAARRRQEAKCTRDVWIASEQDGMSLLMARMATEQAHALKVQLDADAYDRFHTDGVDGSLTMGEHRVEALAALVLGGNGHGPAPTRAHLNITIPLTTLLGLQNDVHGLPVDLVDGQAELAGEGPIPGIVIRELLSDPDCAVTIRRLVTDPITGHLLDYGRMTYDVPQRLRDFVVARDRTCRFPGCNRRADLTQMDHATAWDDGGTTSPDNLGALCVRHHQLKTLGGWDITESRPDGTCTWQSPQGRIYESGTPEPPEPPDSYPPEPTRRDE